LLWQCDFFSKRILTLNGIREVFVHSCSQPASDPIASHVPAERGLGKGAGGTIPRGS
jgi:hypothetical protein